MIKDKKWLKEEIQKKIDQPTIFYSPVVSERKIVYREIINLIDQLEEPKKPVIPKFVADWYESEGKRSSWWNWFYKWGRGEHRTDLETKTIRWMQDFNEELFVDMFRFGYEVEEEQKYQVIIRDGEYIRLYLCKHGDNVIIGTNDNYIEKCPEVTYLTEQEIKDYDERYWEFAQEVTE